MIRIQADVFPSIVGAQLLVIESFAADEVELFFSVDMDPPLGESQAVRTVADIVRRAKIDWIEPRPDRWIIDLNALRRERHVANVLGEVDWFKGKAEVMPELRVTRGFPSLGSHRSAFPSFGQLCFLIRPEHVVPKIPKVFLSYSWDDDDQKAWVKAFAAKLRGHGVDVTLDKWAVAPGDQLPKFMETAVRENEHVLIVCTPNYKVKSDARMGGVGYEGDIMTAEVLNGQNVRKFIPILRRGEWKAAAPSWLAGRFYLDFRGEPYSDETYEELLSNLYGTREQAPPLGTRPIASGGAKLTATGIFVPPPSTPPDDGPIKIKGIVLDEIGTPKNDGTRGSALYRVPFQLSRHPSDDWARHFIQTWDMPPICSTSHRPGIARIEGDRIILDETTVEEVERTHRDTLKVVLDKVNRDIAEHEEKQRRTGEIRAEQLRQHKQSAEEAAKRIKFD